MHNKDAEDMLQKIFRYMNLLVGEKDFYKTIRILTDLGRTLVHSDRVSFWYWDKERKQYWTLATSDDGKITVPEGTGIVGASISGKETIIINRPYEDARFNSEVDKQTGYVTRSILCMPVTNEQGEVIGAYQAINKLDAREGGGFEIQDVNRLTMAAVYSGKMLEMHMLRTASRMDQLTGLKNRRAMYDDYRRLILERENPSGSCVIICDIDHFKKVNDTYGHNAGDAVLTYISGLIKQVVDGNGEVIRWGGEEFLILLPNKGIEDAVTLAEQIRGLIEQSACLYETVSIGVTMSFGVAQIDTSVFSEENIRQADKKLYAAKTNGRNRVVY